MPRPRVHDNPADRQAAYRRRVTEDQEQLKTLRQQAQGKTPLTIPEDRRWFAVELTIERDEMEKPAVIQYVLSEEELERLQRDLRAFKDGTSTTEHGTYAFAQHGDSPNVPGSMTWMFEGITITGNRLLKDFKPVSCYSISEGAVRLILNQPVGR